MKSDDNNLRKGFSFRWREIGRFDRIRQANVAKSEQEKCICVANEVNCRCFCRSDVAAVEGTERPKQAGRLTGGTRPAIRELKGCSGAAAACRVRGQSSREGAN